MRRLALALLALGGLGGCSLIFDTGSLQSGVSNDGGADDSGAGNLLVNGGFEQSGGGCGPGWSVSNGATMTRSSIAHSGGSSCEVCVAGTNGGALNATPGPAFPISATTQLYAEVWVKIEGPATHNVYLDVEEIVAGGATLVNHSGGVSVTDWQELAANSYKAVGGGTGTTFAIGADGKDGGAPSCMLIDDAKLIVQ